MAGLRERKKEWTRRRIADAALRLFAERGFEAVTVNEIAAAADVAKATLFTYFPTKESLVLDGVGGDDLAAVVRSRPAGRSPLAALHDHARSLAATLTAGPPPGDGPGPDVDRLVTRVRVIVDSPTLRGGAGGLQDRQRRALAAALAEAYGAADPAADADRGGAAGLMAAQISGAWRALQEAFFVRLAEGTPLDEAARHLAGDVERAFDLLEHGIPSPGPGPSPHSPA